MNQNFDIIISFFPNKILFLKPLRELSQLSNEVNNYVYDKKRDNAIIL